MHTATLLLAAAADSGDAYDAGYKTGAVLAVLLLLGLGGLALSKGIRANRTPAFSYPPPPPPPLAGHAAPVEAPLPPPPPPPTSSGGVVWIIVGSVLLLLGLLASARAVVIVTDGVGSKQVHRTAAFPATLLGLAHNDALSTQAQGAAGKEFDAQSLAVYGTPPTTLVVVVQTGSLQSPDSEIRGFERGVSSGGGSPLEQGQSVDAGPLGGKGRCWMQTVNGQRTGVCVFADRGSLLAVYDPSATSPLEAAEHGRTIRSAILH